MSSRSVFQWMPRGFCISLSRRATFSSCGAFSIAWPSDEARTVLNQAERAHFSDSSRRFCRLRQKPASAGTSDSSSSLAEVPWAWAKEQSFAPNIRAQVRKQTLSERFMIKPLVSIRGIQRRQFIHKEADGPASIARHGAQTLGDTLSRLTKRLSRRVQGL